MGESKELAKARLKSKLANAKVKLMEAEDDYNSAKSDGEIDDDAACQIADLKDEIKELEEELDQL